MEEKKCLICVSKPVDPALRAFCSMECKLKYIARWREKQRTSIDPALRKEINRLRKLTGEKPLPKGKNLAPSDPNVNKVALHLVVVDLLKRSYEVFQAVSSNACDLVISKNKKFKKVEVRCGYRTKNGARCNRFEKDDCDIYAMVIGGETVIYDPPFKDADGGDNSSLPS